MEGYKINSQFSEAFCNIRKAYRLIYSYQDRMLSLIRFIQKKLDFGEDLSGFKHFSDPIRINFKNKRLDIKSEMSAWDFDYSYLLEYELGVKDNRNDAKTKLYFSIIQYSDTGYFDVDLNSGEKTKLEITQFEKPENSGSKLLFMMHLVPKQVRSYVEPEKYIMDKKYASIKHTADVLTPEGRGRLYKLLLYSMPIERFVDEGKTIEALKEYLVFLHENGIDLAIV